MMGAVKEYHEMTENEIRDLRAENDRLRKALHEIATPMAPIHEWAIGGWPEVVGELRRIARAALEPQS